MYGKLLSSRSTTLKRGRCSLMRLNSSSSASVSEPVTVTSMWRIWRTSASTLGACRSLLEVTADAIAQAGGLADVQQVRCVGARPPYMR